MVKMITRHHRGGVLQGCLIAVIIFVVLVIIGGVVVALNFKPWMSGVVVAGLNAIVDVSEIPDSDKVEIKEVIKELRQEYLAGNVTLEEFGDVLMALETNPAIVMGSIMQFEAVYVTSSTLSDEEKADAKLSLNRVAQGIVSGVLTWRDIEPIVDKVSDIDSSGNRTFRQASAVRESEIRAAINNAKEIADDAGIGMEFVEYNLADEFRRSIEKTLGRSIGDE